MHSSTNIKVIEENIIVGNKTLFVPSPLSSICVSSFYRQCLFIVSSSRRRRFLACLPKPPIKWRSPEFFQRAMAKLFNNADGGRRPPRIGVNEIKAKRANIDSDTEYSASWRFATVTLHRAAFQSARECLIHSFSNAHSTQCLSCGLVLTRP